MPNSRALYAEGIQHGLISTFSLVATEVPTRARAGSLTTSAPPYRRTKATRRYDPVKASVLVAEDDPHIRHQNMLILERAGYRVSAVDNGLSAWDALHTGSYDLLITDNDMPRLTGLELVAKLRLANHKLPIVLASGSADFFRAEEYQWLNFSAFLQKPFAPSKFLQTVLTILEPRLI